MKLLTLSLQNFKGIDKFEIAPDGRNISIHGDNATGKTSVADALCWLLYDADSQGKADFNIKPLHADGSEQHNLETIVEASFAEPEISLKKVYSEKWTKKRGNVKAEFTGHTVDHFVDGVPVAKKEYQSRLALVIPASAKLLTDPFEFASRIHWKKRRDTLLGMVPDINEAALMEDSELVDLPGLLGKHSATELMLIVKSEKAEINKQLQSIPSRIDELKRRQIDPIMKAAVQSHIEDAAFYVGQLEKETQPSAKSDKVQELEASLDALIKTGVEQNKRFHEARDKRNGNIQATQCSIARTEGAVVNAAYKQKELTDTIAKLKSEYKVIRESGPGDCSTCGQAMPIDKFEINRANALEKNIAVGQKKKAELGVISFQIAGLNMALAKVQVSLAEHKAVLLPAVDDDIPKQIESIRAELIAELESTKVDPELTNKLQETRKILASHKETLAGLQGFENVSGRVEELKKEEKKYAAQFEEAERKLYLCELYFRKKTGLVSKTVDGLFRLVSWQLFRDQINGGLEECCEALVQGVPFSTGLNRSAQINAGLDIIGALQGSLKVKLPVIVDNAEAVTKLFEIPGTQIIRLVVDEAAKKLTIKEN